MRGRVRHAGAPLRRARPSHTNRDTTPRATEARSAEGGRKGRLALASGRGRHLLEPEREGRVKSTRVLVILALRLRDLNV